MQRVGDAVKAVQGVARCHFSRWGDGSEHFHLWALARPAGMMQGRGPMLAFWDDVLAGDGLGDEHHRGGAWLLHEQRLADDPTAESARMARRVGAGQWRETYGQPRHKSRLGAPQEPTRRTRPAEARGDIGTRASPAG